ncbi:leucine-rich repeat-containing protein 49-like isoform X1 [Polypterus senegalus]|uniref:leucine-rich repeat-containing protein 49-like isoform X1 n=1 Tax=Polypterus senegalus TaxID=55291 RepID=UPI001964A748|nr:leucine-rich repeat-containing protein 49-like isoform X1 [Polypterus senegalus]
MLQGKYSRGKVVAHRRDINCLPGLQHLLLSCNNITSLDDIACLADSSPHSEVTLDGTPLVIESCYKQNIPRYMVQLRQLDMKKITEEERRTTSALARKEEEKKRESHKQANQKEKRKLAIKNAAQLWDSHLQKADSASRVCLVIPAQNESKEEINFEDGSEQNKRVEQEPDELRSLEPEGRTGAQCLSVSDSHLAELDGNTLRLFGTGALDALERGWGLHTASVVSTISFYYIDYELIAAILSRIRIKFPSVVHLVFSDSNIYQLHQLAALAHVRRLDHLTIHPQGNPVVRLTLWKSYVLFRLSHLKLQRINDQEVTLNDLVMAEKLFGTLANIAETETSHHRLLLLLGESSRKRQLQFFLEGRGRTGLSPESIRENGKLPGEGLGRALLTYPSRDAPKNEENAHAQLSHHYVKMLLQEAVAINQKMETLHKQWPLLFMELVRDSVMEMRDKSAFRRVCLQRIAETK